MKPVKEDNGIKRCKEKIKLYHISTYQTAKCIIGHCCVVAKIHSNNYVLINAETDISIVEATLNLGHKININSIFVQMPCRLNGYFLVFEYYDFSTEACDISQ